MDIKRTFSAAKRDLDSAKNSLDVNDYDTALVMLGNAYADVRALLEAVWCRKRSKKLAANPPGENTK